VKTYRNDRALAAQLPPLPPGGHFRLVIGRTGFLVSVVNSKTGTALGVVLQGTLCHLPEDEIRTFQSDRIHEVYFTQKSGH